MNGNERSNKKDLSTLIEQSARPVDYAKIVTPTARVISIGERHRSNEAVIEEMRNAMPTFRRLGITHFGMEMLSANMQTDIDAYRVNKDSVIRERLRSHLATFGWGTPDRYLDLIEAAHDAGIGVVGLDMPEGVRDDEEVSKRDTFMAKTLTELLSKDREARVITFTGNAHAGRSHSEVPRVAMTDLLRNEGNEVISVATVTLPPLPSYISLVHTLEEAIEGISIKDKRFMIRREDFDDGFPYDWVINVPPLSDRLALTRFLERRERRLK